MNLLSELCAVHAPSGEEHRMADFVLDFVEKNQDSWLQKPQVLNGPELLGAVVLVFGSPRLAAYAHMDSIGYTVRYDNNLVRIGSPAAEAGTELVGYHKGKLFEAVLRENQEGKFSVGNSFEIPRGTTLSYKPKFSYNNGEVVSNYLDNRAGMYILLRLCSVIENGIIAFTCREEHGPGNAGLVARYLYDKFKIGQAIVTDITWITEGVTKGGGAVISLRDKLIPRRVYLDKVIEVAEKAGSSFQLEVEEYGASDGMYIQQSFAPVDWCFIGPPIENAHHPQELVSVSDLESTLGLIKNLFREL